MGPNDSDTWLSPSGNEFIMARQVPDARPAAIPRGERRVSIRICGDHPALLGKGPLSSGQVGEYVDTDWNGKRYVAMYARPDGSVPDPKAEAAIRTLCQP